MSADQVMQLGLLLAVILVVGITALVLLTKVVGRPPGETSTDVMVAKARAELAPLDLPTQVTRQVTHRDEASGEIGPKPD